MLGIDPNQLSLSDYAGAIFQYNLKNADPNSPPPTAQMTQEQMAELDKQTDDMDW